MLYQGGKYRIARHIVPQLLATQWETDADTYIEPFMGGAAVFARVAPYFTHAIGSDAHPDIMLMWQAAVNGWKPPMTLTEAEWRALKTGEPSPLRGFAGFGCSYGGAWFAGYARDPKNGRDFAEDGSRNIPKVAKKMRGAHLLTGDYTMHTPTVNSHTVVYCDPPYSGVKAYRHVGAFDSARFWGVMNDWVSRGAHVFVSEYKAPPEWKTVWHVNKQVSMNKDNKSKWATERLFMHRDQAPL